MVGWDYVRRMGIVSGSCKSLSVKGDVARVRRSGRRWIVDNHSGREKSLPFPYSSYMRKRERLIDPHKVPHRPLMKTIQNAALAAFLLTVAPCLRAATVVLPPITVTSMGTRTDFSKSGSPTAYHSGLSLGIYGAATASTFPTTIVTTGDTIQMSFLPEGGQVFSLLPGYDSLELDVYFGSGGMFYGLPVSVTFLGLRGGSAPVFSAVQAATNSSAIIGGMSTRDQPNAPITFTGLEISWASPDAATVGPLDLSNVLFKTNSLPPDSAAFLSLQSVPEPITALLCGLGLLAFLRRQRSVE